MPYSAPQRNNHSAFLPHNFQIPHNFPAQPENLPNITPRFHPTTVFSKIAVNQGVAASDKLQTG